MTPSFNDGEYLAVFGPQGPIRGLSKHLIWSGLLRRETVVILRAPGRSLNAGTDRLLIKRVVGVPYDRLHITHGVLFVNGHETHEPYVYYASADLKHSDNWPLSPVGDVVVPNQMVFVLGDNRGASLDSRALGPIRSEDLYGIVTGHLPWPPELFEKRSHFAGEPQ
jgi:signal peptidase I